MRKNTRLSPLEQFRRLNLRKKLTVSFSFPIVTLLLLTGIILMLYLSRTTYKDFSKEKQRSCNQTAAALSQYTDTMIYLSLRMRNDSALISAFEEEDAKDLASQYRQFFRLSSAMGSIALTNSSCKLTLYIDDGIIYSGNTVYFAPRSSIAGMSVPPVKGMVQFVLNKTKDGMTLISFIHAGEKYWPCSVTLPSALIQELLSQAAGTDGTLCFLCKKRGTDSLLWERSDKNDSAQEAAGQTLTLPSQNGKSVLYNGKRYLAFTADCSNFSLQTVVLLPVSAIYAKSALAPLISLILVAMLALAVMLVSYMLSGYYARRFTVLSRKIQETANGKFTLSLLDGDEHKMQSADETDIIYNSFLAMQHELRRLMRQNYLQGKSVTASELKALQAQIQPHFLYNTLDLINWEAIKHKAPEISEIATNLGRFYRLSLNRGKNSILIGDELRHVQSYVAIENAHFDGAISLTEHVPQEIKLAACLNIILQPFVENAIVHGIAADKSISSCKIVIEAALREGNITITITDDGPGISPEESLAILASPANKDGKTGYGVRNINTRIKLCYGEPYGVTLTPRPDGTHGTQVSIFIPCLSLEELDEVIAGEGRFA